MLKAQMKTKAVWRQYALHLYCLVNSMSYRQQSSTSIKPKSHLDRLHSISPSKTTLQV